MKKVTGLGGIFFKTADQEKNKDWYRKNLGIESDQYGGKFTWRDDENPDKRCLTVWTLLPGTLLISTHPNKIL